MLAHLNLTQEAMAYGGYPLWYSHRVRRSPQLSNLAECSENAAHWHCFAIVRNPLDRAISSYIHVMGYWKPLGEPFIELGGQRDASFVEFVRALDSRAQTRTRFGGDEHFMPQWDVSGMDHKVDDVTMLSPHLLHIPIEMLSEPGGYECPPLSPMTGWKVAELEERYSAGNGGHYVAKATESPPGSEHWPWERLHAAVARHATPAYDSFWNNTAFCQHVVGCLYRDDLALYVATCKQPSLRRCAAYRTACDGQLERLRTVCGLQIG